MPDLPQPAVERLTLLPLSVRCDSSDWTTLAAQALPCMVERRGEHGAMKGRGAHPETEGVPLELRINIAPACCKGTDAAAVASKVRLFRQDHPRLRGPCHALRRMQ